MAPYRGTSLHDSHQASRSCSTLLLKSFHSLEAWGRAAGRRRRQPLDEAGVQGRPGEDRQGILGDRELGREEWEQLRERRGLRQRRIPLELLIILLVDVTR